MYIGILSVEMSIPYLESIKERRNVLRSIKDMVKKKFNVSIAEITETEDVTPSAKIAVAAVSGDASYLQSILSNVFNMIENFHPEKIVSYKTDIIDYK
ncbi:MAG: DUF503 domain-containing protein [Brevinematales bacterium]|jgi:uncharacterized protein YlxP (DUF503 family)